VIAVAMLPGWAMAQSALGNANPEASFRGSQFSVAPVTGAVAVDNAPRSDEVTTVAATPLPAADLHVDAIPASVTGDATTSESADVPPSIDEAEGRPTMSAATAGIRAHTAKEDLTRQQLADRASHAHVGTDAALMIVGGAGFIAGLIIGGGAGTAIAIAGAAIGLYGLYLYLQ